MFLVYTEQARRKAWLKIPRVARAAIRRLHVALGRQPKAVMLQILKGRKSAAELIEGCKAFKCPDCLDIENSSKVAKTKAPPMYSSNHEVVCDVWFIHDMERTPLGILSQLYVQRYSIPGIRDCDGGHRRAEQWNMLREI